MLTDHCVVLVLQNADVQRLKWGTLAISVIDIFTANNNGEKNSCSLWSSPNSVLFCIVIIERRVIHNH